ncbi:MAG TPA: winged helix DNA-binding domain-containing protein [Nocardioidaceae bacterium]|nr:winged helix DNA-binding domain-containing protein [Nocardioidaceae bacterium]
MRPRRIGTEERRARLAHRHRLLPEQRTDDVSRIADDLVALHSTDPVTVHLSAMARMRHPSVAAVERALYDERAVVRHHAMRRTLWVATPDVVRLMHAAATRRLVAPEHRRLTTMLADNGVTEPERWLADAREQVLASLAAHGPMTARSLGTRVPGLRHGLVMAPGKKYSATVSAHTRVLTLLGFEGRIVRTRPSGSWVSGAYAYALMEDWLEEGLGGLSEREAACALALRWLRAFGPGTTTDLRWWMGWTAGTTRTALADCGAVEVTLDDGPGWLAPGDEEAGTGGDSGPWVALLPSLDPTTMGWKERGWYLPREAASAFDRMGNAGPTVWVDGEVVGVWAQTAAGELRTRFFRDPGAERRAEVGRRLEELASMVGDTRFTVRFPSPAFSALRASTASAPPPSEAGPALG